MLSVKQIIAKFFYQITETSTVIIEGDWEVNSSNEQPVGAPVYVNCGWAQQCIIEPVS